MEEILLEEVNPHGNVKAIVEVDERVCFFYLWGSPDLEWDVRKVWVHNLGPAPADIDFAALRAGDAPMNPAAHCLSASPGVRPVARDLSIIWLPEGNGAALFERGKMIAVIPPWSGVGLAGDRHRAFRVVVYRRDRAPVAPAHVVRFRTHAAL